MTREMKNALLGAALAAIMAGTAVAAGGEPGPGPGPGGGPGMRRGARQMDWANADQRLERMSRRLKLTDEQKGAVKPIIEDEIAKVKEVRGDKDLSRLEKRDRLRQIRQDTHDRIRAVLNPDQQKILDQIRAKSQGRRSRMVPPGPPEAAPKQ